MGMSTNVVGFKPPDDKWDKMKAIWDACEAGETEIPKAVLDYFGGEEPDESGVQVDEDDLLACGGVAEWSGDSAAGYEIHIDNLPKDVKIVRVYNAW